jgi:hypothetical protein
MEKVPNLEDANRKEKRISMRALSAHRLDGPAREATACGKGGSVREELGRSGRIPVKSERKKLICHISTEFGFWQEFENFCMEI